jgi:hypothetical protein
LKILRLLPLHGGSKIEARSDSYVLDRHNPR